MSGKKYKNCCKDDDWVKELKEYGIIYYDEKYMIKDVIKDNNFNKFYFENKSTLPKDLIFGVHKNLGASMSYGTFPPDNNDFRWMIINDKISPIPEYKALEIAHEMQHIINCINHYPVIAFKKEYEGNDNIPCKNISDMLNDPMVNKEILKYGFNMKEYFEKADKIQIPAINTFSGHIKNTFIITLHVKRYLDYKNLDFHINKEDINFIKWCKESYPEFVSYSELIISWIDQIGYETKESAEIILKNTIKLLGHEQYMEVRNF